MSSDSARRRREVQSRIRRLVRLIGLLQSGPPQNASSLARLCGVSRRTIFRDLDVLRQAGVPMLFDDEQGKYDIPQPYYLPPTNFTADEALAVIVLCLEAAATDGLPFCAPAQSAALKLEGALPAPLRRHVRDSALAVQVRRQPVNPLPRHVSIYRRLLAAAARHEVLRMEYDSFTEGAAITTRFSPYRLLFSRHSWYVIGRSSLHRQVRTFNVGRVLSLAPTGESFHLPRTFSIDRYLGNAWHLIPEPGPDHQVHVRFEPLVARNVAEVIWHRTQRAVLRDDGRLDFHVTVSGLHEISWWILGYGDQAQVVAPEPLRQLVARRAWQLARQYSPPGDPQPTTASDAES
jgi:proteasome accessory factor B